MKNILIIHDNKNILDALSAGLRCHLKDCGIVTALIGVKGMNNVESVPIDLIVTDLDMPGMNGDQFIEYAKKLYPDIPVCVLTDGHSPKCTESIEKLQSSGVVRRVEKPFLLDEFLRLISEQLRLEPQSSQTEEHGNPAVAGGAND